MKIKIPSRLLLFWSKNSSRALGRSSLAVALGVFLCHAETSRAASGSWNVDADGVWSGSSNWASNIIADGADNTATFANTLTASRIVTLDTSRTIGNLTFRSTGANIFNLTGTNTVLTLAGSSTPTIDVTGTAVLGTTSTAAAIYLSGTQGFVKTGAGRLNLVTAGSGQLNLLTGDINVSQGSLNLQGTENATLTLGAGTTLLVGNSGGSSSQFLGLNSTGTNGTVAPTSNSRNMIVTGNGNYSYGGSFTGGAGSVSVNIVAALTGGGSQTLRGASTDFRSSTVVGGSLINTTSGTSGTPFGGGSAQIGGSANITTPAGTVAAAGAGALVLAPTAGTGNLSYTVASASNTYTFTYGNGAQLSLNKGTATSLTLTAGNASPSVPVLVRGTSAASVNASNNGTLLLIAGSGLSALGTGTGEKFVINGGVTTTNGIASASIIGQDNDSNKSGSFLGYDATNGFQAATYSASTNINGGTAFSDTRVYNATTSSTNALTADAAVYALRVSGTVSGAGRTLSVGANSASEPAGVILNGGAIATGTLAFGSSSSAVIYTSLAGGTISSNIINATTGTTGGGVTFVGPGVLTLSGSNTFRGGAFIDDSTVAFSSNDALGINTSGSTAGQVTLRGGTLASTADVTVTNRGLNVQYGVTGGGGTLDVAAATTLNFASSTGRVVTGLGSLTKTNSGTLVLSGGVANTYSGGTIIKAGTLSATYTGALGTGGVSIQGTGTTVSTMGTLLVGGTATMSNNFTLSGGQVSRVVASGSAYNLGTTGSVSSSISGGVNTSAAILEAQNATASTTIAYSFDKNAPSGALNDGVRVSDGFLLSNMESGKMFTLQLSIGSVTSADALGWFNTSTNQWVNAVLGNSNAGSMGLTGFQGDGAYVAGSDFVLGYWGYDSSAGTVWAVLDHNSDFGVIAVPEPSALAMMAFGLGLTIVMVRRRISTR